MEHEFDKEIDGLLRGLGRAKSDLPAPSGPHVDADQLAAFLEDALPSQARAAFVAHTANCDPCRELLAAGVTLNEQPARAASAAAAPVFEPKRRWRFLGMPAFAAALSGLLVVVFAGLIGVRYFSEQSSGDTVAVKTEQKQPEPAVSQGATSNSPVPADGIPMPANSNAASAANSAVTAKRGEAPAEAPVVIPQPFSEAPRERVPSDELAEKADKEDESKLSRPMMSSAPPVPKKVEPEFQIDGAQGNENVRADDSVGMGSVAAKAKRGQAEITAKDRALESPPPTRSVSGKTFTQRDGIWYDAAYKGGKTTDRAKRCDTCGVLEPSLQKIIDTLPGTVVVVWKGSNLKFY